MKKELSGAAVAALVVLSGCGGDPSGPPDSKAARKALEGTLRADCKDSYTLEVMGAEAAATPDASGAHALKGTIMLAAKGAATEARACLARIQTSSALGHQQMMEIVVDDFRRREEELQRLENERLRRLAMPRVPGPDGGTDMTDYSRPRTMAEPENILFRVEGSLRRWSSGWKAENVRISPMPGYQTSY